MAEPVRQGQGLPLPPPADSQAGRCPPDQPGSQPHQGLAALLILLGTLARAPPPRPPELTKIMDPPAPAPLPNAAACCPRGTTETGIQLWHAGSTQDLQRSWQRTADGQKRPPSANPVDGGREGGRALPQIGPAHVAFGLSCSSRVGSAAPSLLEPPLDLFCPAKSLRINSVLHRKLRSFGRF